MDPRSTRTSAWSTSTPMTLGDGSIPVLRWKQAGYENLATRRQLREMGLRPGGQQPAVRIECRRGRRIAYLYRIDLAKPKLPMTLAKKLALDKAMTARQTCPGPCGRRYFHCLSLKKLGTCLGLRPRLRPRADNY
ncbi:RRQRL motif-containing zinc-binding protein [Streptomyces griseorubiginosus]|uniref:RRQRL motif-containing zinc-binding protein n=1 Tax=Streptomyces griseorubiginosus TaxID=67304 RepID=UPI0036808587